MANQHMNSFFLCSCSFGVHFLWTVQLTSFLAGKIPEAAKF